MFFRSRLLFLHTQEGEEGGCTLMTALLLHCPHCTDHHHLHIAQVQVHCTRVHSEVHTSHHTLCPAIYLPHTVMHHTEWDVHHTLWWPTVDHTSALWWSPFFRLMLLGHTTPIQCSCRWPQNIHKLKSFLAFTARVTAAHADGDRLGQLLTFWPTKTLVLANVYAQVPVIFL